MPGVVIASPFPFPDHEATTHVVVYQEQDTEDQGPIKTVIYDGLAIYDEKSKIVYGKDSIYLLALRTNLYKALASCLALQGLSIAMSDKHTAAGYLLAVFAVYTL